MDGVRVEFLDQVRGRGLIATRDFAAEETIFTEMPLVSCQYTYNKVRTRAATAV